jgi:hypothetical protein
MEAMLMKKMGKTLMVAALLAGMSTSASAAVDGNCGQGEVTCLQVERSLEEKFEFLKGKGIFTGQKDGKANFDQKMTKAQLAVVLNLMFGLTDRYESLTFQDTNGHWAEKEIGAAVQGGLIPAEQDKHFKPNAYVPLEQAAAAFVKALELDEGAYAYIPSLAASNEYKPYVAAALTEGMLTQTDDYRKLALRSGFVQLAYAVDAWRESKGGKGIVAGSIERKATVKKLEEGGYEFTFTFKNQTEREQTLFFPSGQRFDFNLYEEGKHVYSYSAIRSFTMATSEIQLKQGEELSYTEHVSDLPKGTYTMEFWLTANSHEERQTIEFE